MEEYEQLEAIEAPGIIDILQPYYMEVGIHYLIFLFLSLGWCLFITLKTKKENQEKSFRSISIIILFTIGMLVFGIGTDLIDCFNVSNIEGRMRPELVLVKIGERAYQLHALGLYLILTSGILLIVHLRKKV